VGHKVDVGKFLRLVVQYEAGTATGCVIYGLTVLGKMLFDAADFCKSVHQIVITGSVMMGLPINNSFFGLTGEASG